MAFGSNPRLAARMQSDQAAAQDRNSRASSAAAKQAAGPNFRANVTPDMSPDQARFTQAQAYQNYSANQAGRQNYAADVSSGMKTDEARSTQASAYRNATGGQLPQAQQQPAKPNPDAGPYGAYAAPGGGGYSSYAQPTKAAAQQAMPQFQQYGRQNDLSQPQGFNMWGAQGYAQGGQQGQSYTLPGYSQSFNGLTGQPTSQPQQSWAGNLAYQAPANRPAPVSWTTQGMDGQTYDGQQGFQQATQQRDAFMGGQGGLFDRLGQYAANPQLGPPQFDFQGMLNSANNAISNTGFQNPFTNPMAQNQTPSFSQPSYDPRPTAIQQAQPRGQEAGDYRGGGRDLTDDIVQWTDQGWRRQSEMQPGGNQQYAGGTPYFDERTAQYTNSAPGAVFDPNFRPTANAAPLPTSNPTDQATYRPRVSGTPGSRSAIVGGDMALSEEMLGTQEFDRIVAEYEGRYGQRQGFQDAGRMQRAAKPGDAQPVGTESIGAPYGSSTADSLPPVPPVIRAAEESLDYRTQTPRRNASPPMSATGDIAEQAAQAQQAELSRMQASRQPPAPAGRPAMTPDEAAASARAGNPYPQRSPIEDFQWRLANSTYGLADAPTADSGQTAPTGYRQTYRGPRQDFANPARQDTTSTAGGRHVPQGTDQSVRAQLTKIDTELNKWERATYGTWQGSGPPQAWHDHINNLKRLRQRALAGDPAALAWSPKMQAPPPKQHAVVTPSQRNTDRSGSQRRNAR